MSNIEKPKPKPKNIKNFSSSTEYTEYRARLKRLWKTLPPSPVKQRKDMISPYFKYRFMHWIHSRTIFFWCGCLSVAMVFTTNLVRRYRYGPDHPLNFFNWYMKEYVYGTLPDKYAEKAKKFNDMSKAKVKEDDSSFDNYFFYRYGHGGLDPGGADVPNP